MLFADRISRWHGGRLVPGLCLALVLLTTLVAVTSDAFAHGVAGKDAAFVAANSGMQLIPFLYLGAKHMVTGYDHLLFILGVIFFLYRLSHVAIYVTLFSIGHSVTLLTGVLNNIHVDPYLIDAVIGLSVAYKAFDNLGGFQTVFGFQPSIRGAVFAFGLVHGFGLATKLQALSLSPDGLVANMVAFNVGVELGQLVALSAMLLLIVWWRARANFQQHAVIANGLLMIAGFALTQFQLIGYLIQEGA
ncbi:MAG: HupE/UreJ family protein [Alphaproteobacteria bacterium]|nr:HupE/UreJ family protein [Alphaproteobacteria bacterium]